LSDSKISNLTAVTMPLNSTDVLPIVQGGTTKKVTVAELQNTVDINGGTIDGTVIGMTARADAKFGAVDSNDHLTMSGGNVRFTGERYVYSYAGGTVSEIKSGIYLDGSGGTQRIYINNAEVGRWAGADFKVTTGNLVIGTAGKGIDFSSTASGIMWRAGTGSPEGSVTASVGSLYTRSDGGAGTTLYVKESGSGNTGWKGK